MRAPESVRTGLLGTGAWSPIVAGAIVALVSMIASMPIESTIVHPDEVGYILNASNLLGGPPSRLPYFPGYSVFLTPVLALSDDLGTIVRGVQRNHGKHRVDQRTEARPVRAAIVDRPELHPAIVCVPIVPPVQCGQESLHRWNVFV